MFTLRLARCFLCRKKEEFKSKDIDTACPSSQKSVRLVLEYLAKVAKIELFISKNEVLCLNCYLQIADYDTSLVKVHQKQRLLTQLVCKAVSNVDSDVEEEYLSMESQMNSMDELNDSHFFDNVQISKVEINQAVKEALAPPKIRNEDKRNEEKELRQCNLCAMRFKTKLRLERHVAHAHKKYSCDMCTFSHRNEDHVLLHRNIHEGRSENQCRFCDKVFTTKISTIRHMEVHLNSKKYMCDKCGLCFSQTTVLYNHKLQHEAEEQPLRCEICIQVFKTKRTYRHHMITHRQDRPRYSCEYCSKTFTEKYTLKVHRRIHPEVAQEEAISIEIQTASTDVQETLFAVTADPKFNCIICDQSFTSKDQMNKHMEREHDVILKSLTLSNFSQYEVVTNEPKKPCQFCGQMFSTQSNLEYHLEHVHGVIL